MIIEVYTDGAYSSSRDMGGFAFVVLENKEKIHSYFFNEPNTTNNRMEIVAVLKALYWLKEVGKLNEEIIIYTDSMYVIGSMTKNWKRNKNVDLFTELDNIYKQFKTVVFMHIKGHSGDKYNELCDKLAVIASQSK